MNSGNLFHRAANEGQEGSNVFIDIVDGQIDVVGINGKSRVSTERRETYTNSCFCRASLLSIKLIDFLLNSKEQ